MKPARIVSLTDGIFAISFIDTRLSLVLFAIPPVFSLLPIRARQQATGEPTKKLANS